MAKGSKSACCYTQLFLMCILLLNLPSVYALATVKGTLDFGDKNPFEGGVFPPIPVLLKGKNEYHSYVQANGKFLFAAIPEGRYALSVISEAYLFSTYKIDVSSDHTVQALEYKYPGAEKSQASYPLQITAHLKFNYFTKREKFNLLRTIMANPSFLMMGMMALMVFIMPKMMENMDPEEMKKMQEDMQQNDPKNMLKGMFGQKDEDDD